MPGFYLSAGQEVDEEGPGLAEIGGPHHHPLQHRHVGGRGGERRPPGRAPDRPLGLHLGEAGREVRSGVLLGGELHHRPARLTRHQERLHPVRVGAVHPDRRAAGRGDPPECGVEVVDLEREVVRAVTVEGEEPRQEVVPGGVPRFEQLHRHAPSCVADSDLDRPEPEELAARQDGPAELGYEPGQRRGGVGGGERHVVQIHRGAQVAAGLGVAGRRPARVQARAIT